MVTGMSIHALPSEPVVAVVGATGIVGETLLTLLAEREFPLAELRLLASPRSAGTHVSFRGAELEVTAASPEAFEGVDLVFFAATGDLSATLAPEARARGALVIDKSATFRADADVPLVVPEVNGAELAQHAGLIACPNCTTIGLVMALEPLRRAAGLERVVVTTTQAASGAGRGPLEELESQQRALGAGQPPTAEHWPEILAANVLPVCGGELEGGETGEEEKLRSESRRILGLPELVVEPTCLRVPVPVGHGASVFVETTRPLTVDEARAAWEAFPGLRLVDQPTARQVAGTDEVLVGRIRSASSGRGLLFWEVADNLRKGAATNAVQIAELLLGV